MKKKKLIIGVSSIFVIVTFAIIISLTLSKSDNDVVLSDNENNKNFINNSFLTLMLEQSDGSYLESTSNTWPSGNYAFNSELSRCENDGELRWDRENGIVELLSNKSDACYVYFDLYNVVEISNVSTSTTYNSITVTVTKSGGENPVDKYYFSIDGGNSYQESTTPSYTFSNLTMNHEYTIQVYAKDTLGYESNEEVIEVTTDNYVNPVVNSVTATSVSNNSITVSVNASGGTNSISRYYYSSNGGSSYTNTTSNTYTFSGLSAGQTYQIRVYVVDSNGIQSNVYNLSVQTDDTVLLADYIKGLYTSQGSNGIYYHTSSLANSAGDNSYRYAGANPNNYVCFGSNASTCPSDNLYRIIGVFGSEVKLIKSTSYGNYYWSGSSTNQSNTWSSSTLNTSTLNGTYLNNLGSAWSNLIANHTWKVGGAAFSNVYNGAPQTAYNYEVGSNSSSTTYSAKIGLMYVSDYGFAASNSYWTSTLGSYNSSSITSNNWMYLGSNEWTISLSSDNSGTVYYAFYVNYTGYVDSNRVYRSSYAVRPSFYLTFSTQYVSGSGTSSDPIRIN